MEKKKELMLNIFFATIALFSTIGAVSLTLKDYSIWLLVSTFLISIFSSLFSNKIFKKFKYLIEIKKRFHSVITYSILTFILVLLIGSIGEGTSNISYHLGLIFLALLFITYGIIIFNLVWILYYLSKFKCKF